jgi:hypothetical protein
MNEVRNNFLWLFWQFVEVCHADFVVFRIGKNFAKKLKRIVDSQILEKM